MESSPVTSPLPGDLALTLTLSSSPSSPAPAPAPPAQLQLPCRDDGRHLRPDERGVRLVQLLLVCAAHAASGDLHGADHCLAHISALSSPSGDTMQRLASHFAAALAARVLRLRWPGLLSALGHLGEDPAAVAAGKVAFARALPYIPFARAVATGSVLRAAAAHEGVVHVVGMGWQWDPTLWIALLRGFCLLRRGTLRLRVTFAGSNEGDLESLGPALLKEANLADLSLRVDAIDCPLRELNAGMLKVEAGETLAVVSVLGLRQLLAEPGDGDPRGGTAHRFLSELRSLSPATVVAVEQVEAETGAAGAGERFVEGLHYYSSLFDSVDAAASAGRLSPGERAAVETVLGHEVEDVMERSERSGRWTGRFVRAGFRPAALWRGALEEAKRVVEAYRADGIGGYGLAAEPGRATISWHDRPMYSVSAWQC
uniref:Scarecrow-like protein 3 n=1 Tax=Anthurium amnicola TaxID=1678845 RepID=A0A1D1XJD7_9ARAE